MGSDQSILKPYGCEDVNIAMCVSIVMPMYYTREEVSPGDLVLARASWNLILSDGAPAFVKARENPDFTELSCLTYFYTTFYGRLFDIHPACKSLFKNNIQTQGKALAKIISFLLKDHNDKTMLNQVMEDLAERHINTYFVKAHEYGILGEVLLYALARCVGGERFDMETSLAWVRIYSMVISIVVPIHVKAELHQTHGNGRPTEHTCLKVPSAQLSHSSANSVANSTVSSTKNSDVINL
jgi:hemoglobin-like flavoprotein